MTDLPQLSIFQKITRRGNNLIMTALVPLHHPSPVFKWLFKVPLLLAKLGLFRLIPGWMLILTTTGRKSGKLRRTPMEYLYRPAENTYWVMSGWAGNTDWYKNARANPNVRVQLGGAGSRHFETTAEPLDEDSVVQYLIDILRVNPAAIHIFSRWANRPIDASEASLREAARYFPGLALKR
jgi:deazaflavin-dependent oxidoreductase (nitroreductase family)